MSNQKVQHFSHPHSLTPLKQEPADTSYNCKGCQRLISEPFHGCFECKFYLHDECLEAPRSLSHPSHPSHHLTLLPFPLYPNRSFRCDGCGLNGNAFTYSCSLCSFDLHTYCALSPTTIVLDKHRHELKLVFDDDKFRNSIFICDVCYYVVDSKNWLYYCSDCDYGTHLHCASSERWPLKLQDQPNSNLTDPDYNVQLHHHEASVKDHQPTATDIKVDDVRDDSCVAIKQKRRDGRLEHLSQAVYEVTEIQIMVTKLQNLLSKAYIYE